MKKNFTLNIIRTVLVVILTFTAITLNSGCAGTAKADNPTPSQSDTKKILGVWAGGAMTLQTDPNNLQSTVDFASNTVDVSALPLFGAFAPGMKVQFKSNNTVIASDGKNDGQDYFWGVNAVDDHTFQLTSSNVAVATVKIKAISDISAVLYITFANSIKATINNASVTTYDATATVNYLGKQ